MKNPRLIKVVIPSAVLLSALVVYQWNQSPEASEQTGNDPASRAPRAANSVLHEKHSLASKGMLWEKAARNDRERAVKSVLIDHNSFAPAMSAEIGSPITLRLSKKMPEIQGEVTGRATHGDGTVVTNIVIPGSPVGQLSIQENAEMDFFLAQLYYQNHPVAYEFKNDGNDLVATRHEISDLLCSLIDRKEGEVEHMGLPPADKAHGKECDAADQASIAKAKKLLEEAKGGGGGGKDTTGGGGGGTKGGGKGGKNTTVNISVANASISEGNSGSKNLAFTIALSSADTANTISVGYATANGSATAGSDYVAKSGTATFAPGVTSAVVNVSITGDTNVESDETFALNLSSAVNAAISDSQAIGTIVNDDTTPSSVPVFNSLPGAVAVAYLDMDGQTVSGTYWAGGATIVARGIDTTLTDSQMLNICKRVAEDFAPFNINVTTEESVYLAAPANRRTRCIITPDNEWYGSAGGVAYVNSFTWTGDTPCWTFSDMLSNSPRYIAEATSHEIGHTLGLRHDGRISPSEGYYQGHSTGEIGWAPIMGVGYYKLLVQWSKGEYLSANNTENDLSIITTNNGFGYRPDQVGNTPGTASPLSGGSGARSASGIIETGSDIDVFSFSTAGGSCSFTALGDAASQDLDILLEILNGSGAVVASANPDALTDATVSATLAAGNYYLRIQGVGRGDALSDGYSDYGSLGQYTISGNAP